METGTLKQIIEAKTNTDLQTIIKDLSSIHPIFIMYEHNIDLCAHTSEFTTLQSIIEILWEELEKG